MNMDEFEPKKIAKEDVEFRASDIEVADGASFFEKPEDLKRKKKLEEKRMKAEAKRVSRESRRGSRKGADIAKNQSNYVPMSTEKRRRIGKGLLICLAVLAGAALIAGIIYIYNTYWKADETKTLTDEERSAVLNEIEHYYLYKTDDEIDENAKEIYAYLGNIYDEYDDDAIRAASLYRRILLLQNIEYYREEVLADALKGEELEHSLRSAGWLAQLYSEMGDEENAAKYNKLVEERSAPVGPEQPGQG